MKDLIIFAAIVLPFCWVFWGHREAYFNRIKNQARLPSGNADIRLVINADRVSKRMDFLLQGLLQVILAGIIATALDQWWVALTWIFYAGASKLLVGEAFYGKKMVGDWLYSGKGGQFDQDEMGGKLPWFFTKVVIFFAAAVILFYTL